MLALWSTLVPLIIGSAVVPVQLVATIVLLRSSLRTAAAWVAGMAVVRLVQGFVFGVLFSEASAGSTASGGPGIVASGLLLAISLLFYVTAIRQLLGGDDGEDAPPKWMSRVGAMSPLTAFGAGAGYVAIAPKFWVFTLGAIGAIADAKLGSTAATLTFLAFVVLALSGNLVILGYVLASPTRSTAALNGLVDWLTRNNRVIMIALGLLFGTWFLAKALSGLGFL